MVKIKIISFIISFFILFTLVSWFFRPMNDGWGGSVIYYEPRNTIDVLFVGSSHIFCGVNPSILWREEGIASFDYAGSSQTIWNSYYYICESLKYQKPSLVLLDILNTGAKFENDFTDYPRQVAYSTFKPSLNKVNIINVGAEPENRLLWNIDLLFFHTRWKNITSGSLPTTRSNYLNKNTFRYKGYDGGYTLVDTSISSDLNTAIYPPTDGTLAEIPEKNLLYLMKIINLSKEKGFKLVFIKTPFTLMSFDVTSNTIKKIAEENNIDFIDFNYNKHREAMDIDYTTDFRDAAHPNISGAEKLSKYIANILKEKYDIPDRRGDSRYKSWDDTAEKYFLHKALENVKLNTSFSAYLTALQECNKDLIIITAAKDESGTKIVELNNLLTSFGITTDFTDKYGYGFISIYEPSSEYLYEEISPEKLKKEVLKHNFPINIEAVSAGIQYGNVASIKIDGIEYSKNQRGLNVVIYNKESETIFDSFSVDIYEDDTFTIMR